MRVKVRGDALQGRGAQAALPGEQSFAAGFGKEIDQDVERVAPRSATRPEVAKQATNEQPSGRLSLSDLFFPGRARAAAAPRSAHAPSASVRPSPQRPVAPETPRARPVAASGPRRLRNDRATASTAPVHPEQHTGVTPRMVWLLGVLWICVGILLWSRDMLLWE